MLQPIVIGFSNRLTSIENKIDCQHIIESSFNVNMSTEHRTVAMAVFYRNDCKLVLHEFLPNFQPLRISWSTLWFNRIHWSTCSTPSALCKWWWGKFGSLLSARLIELLLRFSVHRSEFQLKLRLEHFPTNSFHFYIM